MINIKTIGENLLSLSNDIKKQDWNKLSPDKVYEKVSTLCNKYEIHSFDIDELKNIEFTMIEVEAILNTYIIWNVVNIQTNNR